MPPLQSKIKSRFKVSHFVPDKLSLVDWDGFDELEKKAAVKFFVAKNSGHLLSHLQQGQGYFLEEWTVLTPRAMTHYARGYFQYLLEQLQNDEPDEEFVFYLMGALYQIIYIHKGSPFTREQTALIKGLVSYALEVICDNPVFEYFARDIENSAEDFFRELNKYVL